MKLLYIATTILFFNNFNYAQDNNSYEISKEFRNTNFVKGEDRFSYMSSFFDKFLRETGLFAHHPFDKEEYNNVIHMFAVLLENTTQHNKYEDKRGQISIILRGDDLVFKVTNPHQTIFPEKLKNLKFYASQSKDIEDTFEDFVPREQLDKDGTKRGVAVGTLLVDLEVLTDKKYLEDIYAHFYEDIDPDTWDKLFNVEIVFPKAKRSCTSIIRSFQGLI